MNRRLVTLGTFAGGIAAAAVVGMSAAHADDLVYTLGTGGDFYDQLSTTAFRNVEQGYTYLNVDDTTTGVTTSDGTYAYGNEVLNPFTGAVESFHLSTYDGSDLGIPDGTQVDQWDFIAGYANQFVDIPGVDGALNTISDTLLTPFGDFTLFSF
jgi:hypothetical protein